MPHQDKRKIEVILGIRGSRLQDLQHTRLAFQSSLDIFNISFGESIHHHHQSESVYSLISLERELCMLCSAMLYDPIRSDQRGIREVGMLCFFCLSDTEIGKVRSEYLR